MLKEIKLEAIRNFNDPTRKFWIIIYSIFVQFFTIVTLYASINLGNYITNKEIVEILVKSTNTVLILCLPAMSIILCYYSIISDPTMNILTVMSSSRSKLILVKSISLFIIMYIITLCNLIFSFTIISLLYLESNFPILILLTFIFLGCVNAFYVSSINFMFLLIQKFTRNKTSTLFFPIIVYFIIPFLISSSISFNLLYPRIIDFSPTIWIIKAMNNIIFTRIISPLEIILLISTLLLQIFSLKLFNQIEID